MTRDGTNGSWWLARVLPAALFALAVGTGSAAAQTAPATPQPATPAPAPVTPPAPATPPTAVPNATPDADGAQELTLEARPALILRGDATWEDGFATLTRSFASLQDAATKSGLQVAGKPLAYFVQTDDQGFRYEAMLPLGATPPSGAAVGAASVGQTPAGRTLRFPNTGAYDDIDSVYEAITAYVEEKGLTAKGTFLEEYIALPSTSDDPSLQLNIYVFLQ